MRTNVTLALALALALTGCKSQIVKVPVYQEIVVQHPTQTPSPTVANPPIRAVGAGEISAEAALPENSGRIYYVLSQEALNALLTDDVAKLEYAQSETLRANFYKKIIEDFNARVRELNENTAK